MQGPRRIAVAIRYDGTRYHGWQSQGVELSTVQRKVELALSSVVGQSITVNCAGRTDAGVHATAQIVHFDTDVDRSNHSWVFGANSNLPKDISLLWAQEVSFDFHARFSAINRLYRYVIFNHDVRPGILRHAVGWYHRPLDADLMQAAAQHLLGEHDFSSFRGPGCQAKTPNRELQCLTVTRERRMIIIEAQANAFLQHMVRNLTGVLLEVGSGKKSPDWAAEVLAAKDSSRAPIRAAPQGLYLVRVKYPDNFNLQAMPLGPFFLA